jgi:hypothetical protein
LERIIEEMEYEEQEKVTDREKFMRSKA